MSSTGELGSVGETPELTDQQITKAALSGARWLPTAQLANQGARVVSSLVLAWFLTTEDFGLVAVATVAMSLVDRLADMGTGQAVIQRKVLDDRLANAIFALNTAIGLVLGGTIIIAAEPITALVGGSNASAAVDLMRVLGLNVIIKSFGVVQFGMLRRRLQFKKAAASVMGGSVAYLITTIALALNGFGPWSLVIGTTVGSFVSVALSSILSRWRPKLQFDFEAIRSIAGFSLGLTGTAIFNYATQNVDRSLIAHSLGVGPLGVYALGVRVLRSPLILVTKAVNQVMVPVLSRMQDDLEKQRKHFLTVSATTLLIVGPSMTGLAVLADPLVEIALPERWAESAPLIEVMAIVGIVRALWGLVSPLYVANAKTGRQFVWSIILGSMLIASYVITARISILAVVIGIGVVHVLAAPIFFAMSFRIIKLPFFDYVKALAPGAIIVALMGGAVALSRVLSEAQGWSSLTESALGMAVGIVVFVGLAAVIKPPGFAQILKLVNARIVTGLRRRNRRQVAT